MKSPIARILQAVLLITLLIAALAFVTTLPNDGGSGNYKHGLSGRSSSTVVVDTPAP